MTRLSPLVFGVAFASAAIAFGQTADPLPTIPPAEPPAAPLLEVPAPEAPSEEVEGPRGALKLTKLGVDPADDAKTRLIKEMHDCAVDETDALLVLFETGGSAQFAFAEEQLCEATDRLKNARLRLAKNGAERIVAFEASLAVRQYLEAIAKARDDLGLAPPFALHQARGRRIEAEIWLLEAKEAAVPAPAKRR